MSAPIHQQIDGLRVLARVLSPSQLKKAGSISRESEAIHLINMLKDAAETLEEQEREIDNLREGQGF
jgi:hypothetical protein